MSEERKKLSAIDRAVCAAGSLVYGLFGDRPLSHQLFKASVEGQWEGSEHNRLRMRPGRRTAALDTDLNYGQREDLLSEARSLEQTYPICKSIKNKYADYCVGKCRVRWNTGDRNIDKEYRAAWDSWMKVCDLKAKHQFPKLMKLACSQGFAEGDMFVQLVDASGQLMINLIEADRVSSAGIFNADQYTADGPSLIGGIGLDPKTGRARFIRVWQRTIYGTFVNAVEIPKVDFLHYFDSARVDAERGVTGYHAVLNTLRDFKDIDDAQRAKTKLNSMLVFLAKTLAGPQSAAVQLMDSQETHANANDNVVAQRVSKGAIAYMFPNENFQIHQGNDPGEAWQKHMEMLVRLIALGCNLPFGVVWNMAGLPKPGVLVELNQAERTIVSVQEQLEARLIIPICGRWLAKEMSAKRLPFSPNWFDYAVSRPSFISIDAGRDSTAAINERKMGMKTLRRWYDETEDDWIDEIDQCIAERKYLEDACKLAGVDPNNIVMMNQNPSGSAMPDDAISTGKALGQ